MIPDSPSEYLGWVFKQGGRPEMGRGASSTDVKTVVVTLFFSGVV